MHPPIDGVLAVLDHPHAAGLATQEAAAAIVRGGASTIQLRAKRSSSSERIALLDRLAPLCRDAGASLFIDDDIEAALACRGKIAGVHLGQADLRALADHRGSPAGALARVRDAGLLIGISTHRAEQVEAARALAPDYLGFGPVWVTSSKAHADPSTGLTALAWACAHAERPVVAIGGITLARARDCIDAGAAAVAVISALVAVSASEVELLTRRLVHSLAPNR